MRQKLITLDETTWKLAQKKTNFSGWIRNQLRSERNRSENDDAMLANTARKLTEVANITTSELLYHLENRTEAEITALLSILRGSLQ